MDQSLLLVGSHGLVLFYVMRFQASTMKEIATSLGLTERRIAVVISDLVDANYLEVQKRGRRNRYSINTRASFRHPTMSHVHLSDFERLLFPDRQADSSIGPSLDEGSSAIPAGPSSPRTSDR